MLIYCSALCSWWCSSVLILSVSFSFPSQTVQPPDKRRKEPHTGSVVLFRGCLVPNSEIFDENGNILIHLANITRSFCLIAKAAQMRLKFDPPASRKQPSLSYKSMPLLQSPKPSPNSLPGRLAALRLRGDYSP